MEKICETMKRVHWPLTGMFALAVVAVMLVPASVSAHCAGKHNVDGHPHCTGGGVDDRITGCVTFAGGNAIVGDLVGVYCDQAATSGAFGGTTRMQVAMDCQFDQFNLFPGGGGPHVSLTVDPAIQTSISSCKLGTVTQDIDFLTTDTFIGKGVGPDCDGVEPERGWWGFDQLLRTKPGAINVCNLKEGEDSIEVSMRFQNNLHHRNDCKGSAKKCGTNIEPIELNYPDNGNDAVTITCVGMDGTQCDQWTIVALGDAELTHGQGDVSVDGSFQATFTTLP